VKNDYQLMMCDCEVFNDMCDIVIHCLWQMMTTCLMWLNVMILLLCDIDIPVEERTVLIITDAMMPVRSIPIVGDEERWREVLKSMVMMEGYWRRNCIV